MASYLLSGNTLSNFLASIIGLVIITIGYYVCLTVYRLYFSPISHIPGPKLAAATWGYEFYYNVIQGGQFYKQIAKLHKQYGPIVRITPLEVHIDDPEFYDTIYSNSERRDKTPWHHNPYTADKATFATSNHELHRTRRGTLNPYFSKSQIRKFTPWIQDRADVLCRRFTEEYKGTDEIVALNEAFACLTADVVMEYSFAENYNLVENPGFIAPLNKVLEVYLRSVHVASYFPIIVQLQVNILPKWFVTWLDPQSDTILTWQNDIERQIDSVMSGTNQKNQDVSHATIFHEILQSHRPAQEKSKQRLFDEAQTIVSAGVETTAWTMSVTMFYLLNNKEIMDKLTKELEEAWTDPSTPLDLATLEALPYLTAVIQEGLRLAYGGAQRLPRISPDKDIPYTNPSGSKTYLLPRGTPISMSSLIMHHNETVFPQSHTFAPERWLPSPPEHLRAPVIANSKNFNEKEKEKPLSRYLVSFTKGSRTCLGMQLAYAELYITLANVVRKNKFELFETGEVDVVCDREFLLARPKEGSLGVRVKVV
ncbi:hypothetical protein EG329_014363 [Mollisiaceae sp. DMI_Dod_QoI]|nr:hypothetical protein EG329_014363 [Helotiales sp. DMI_Dod_QoI]